MKDNRTINLPTTADAAEAEEEMAATGLGKFKDVRALLEAYQALEAEFTRRSQRLKELEANKEAYSPAQAASEDAPSQEAIGQKREITLEELDDEIKNAVIEEYLDGLSKNRGVPFVTGGGAVAACRRKPSTMKEAGALAGKLFNNKEEN